LSLREVDEALCDGTSIGGSAFALKGEFSFVETAFSNFCKRVW